MTKEGQRPLFNDFGQVMELKESQDPKNYLFSREAVPFHWDGAFHEVPSILLFNCIQAMGKGGETIFTNTESIWDSWSEEKRNQLARIKVQYTTEKKAHYGGTISQDLLAKHPKTGASVLRFGEEVKTKLNPVNRRASNPKDEVFLQDLDRMLYDQKFCYQHRWQEGDILLADNHSLLHGRRPFQAEVKARHIRRIQIR